MVHSTAILTSIFLRAALAAAGVLWFAPNALATEDMATIHLKTPIVVHGQTITLGDLFTNTGGSHSVPVGPAPAPGARINLGAVEIGRLVRDHGLDWPNMRNLTRIPVTGDSQVVSRQDIEQALADAIAPDLDGSNVEITLLGRVDPIHLSPDALPTIDVTITDLDRDSGRFRARIGPMSQGGSHNDQIVTGRAQRLVAVPVLSRTLSRDTVIGPRDWEWKEQRADRLPRTILLDGEELTGQALRRTIRAGQPLRQSDVAPPALVERGDLVTMVIRRPGMELTALGRALGEGAKGDVIRLRNTQSMRIVEARIIGAGQVEPVAGPIRTAQR